MPRAARVEFDWNLLMGRLIRAPLLMATLTMLVPSTGYSWGPDGHRIVCEVAYQRLTPRALELVSSLQGGGRKKFVESCLWADEARDTTHEETYSYHFINIPAGGQNADMSRDCREGCVPWAIEHYARTLTDPSASRRGRSEALKFLAHFVADIHQPLHAGRLEDRGGNEIETSFFGDCGTREDPLNLHRVWNWRLLDHCGGRWRAIARQLHGSIEDGEAREWCDFEFVEWAQRIASHRRELRLSRARQGRDRVPLLPPGGSGMSTYVFSRRRFVSPSCSTTSPRGRRDLAPLTSPETEVTP